MHLTLLTIFFTFTTVFSTIPSIQGNDFIKNLKQKAHKWTSRPYIPVNTRKRFSELEDSFDSRSKWPYCSSLTTIRDQGQCRVCWAFAAASVMSDRLCIATKGEQQVVFSAEELVSCCSVCSGCNEDCGEMEAPYKYWIEHGVPSGGDQDSGIGCKPFTARDSGVTPQCTSSCVNGQNYTEDLRYGEQSYTIVPSNIEEIQIEISTNGPVASLFVVYEDFYDYDSGIYQQTYGDAVYAYAVKIVGWGVENEIPYWIVANSWGQSWGENGFFRIRRGNNECLIETIIIAGLPKVDESETTTPQPTSKPEPSGCDINKYSSWIIFLIVYITSYLHL